MKAINYCMATVIFTGLLLSNPVAKAQAFSIIDPQHVFSYLTATQLDPSACPVNSNLGCSTVAGKVAQPQLCGGGSIRIVLVRMPGSQPPFGGGGSSPAAYESAIAAVSATDCTFSMPQVVNFFTCCSGTQDGASYGLIGVGVFGNSSNTAWVACTGGPCPSAIPNSQPVANAYVTNLGSNSLSVVNTGTNSVSATIPVGHNPVSVAVTPSGSAAYVTNAGSNSVSVIDTNALTVLTTITVGGNPVSVAITPDGKQAYVANARSNSVSVINTATNSVTATIPVGFSPLKVAVTPDGGTVYVSNFGAHSLSVISTATNTVVATVPVGVLPVSIAVQ